MNYFVYEMTKYRAAFVGTEKKQIIHTLEYYRNQRKKDFVKVPGESAISEREKVNIQCVRPMSGKGLLEAEVRENFVIGITDSAYSYVERTARYYERLRRGELFKFEPGEGLFEVYFLPEFVMQGLRDYDWNKHKVREWVRNREESCRKLERTGLLLTRKSLCYLLN
jgi:hypothetical protein